MKVVLSPKELGEILRKHFSEQGYVIGDIYTTTKWGNLTSIDLEIKPKEN